jgi:hypothetical protein
MKFTDLLKNWIDARESYNEACRDEQYDNPYLDEQREIMVKYEDQINDVIESLEAVQAWDSMIQTATLRQ